MELLQTVPILRIFDVAKAREFCLDYLGFGTDWEHRFEPALPLYMQTGLEDFHRELTRMDYRYQRPGWRWRRGMRS